MSEIQGKGRIMKEKLTKLIEGLLCSKLPSIINEDERKNKIENVIFNIFNKNNEENIDINEIVILLKTTYLENIRKVLKEHKQEFSDIVRDTIIKKSKLIENIIKT